MTFLAILVGTLVAGIGSVWLAAWLSFGILSRYTQHMLSLAAGALMATSFLHLLPEAFESEVGAHQLFLTLLMVWCSFSCSTRQNFGTTAMNTDTTMAPMITIITMATSTPPMALTPVSRPVGNGRFWQATVCIVLAMAS